MVATPPTSLMRRTLTRSMSYSGPRTLAEPWITWRPEQYDLFPTETSTGPFFEMLGTSPEHKRQIFYESTHFVPRTQSVKETLDWLDRYLGPVN